VETAGEGEAVEVGLNVAEHAEEDAAENAGSHVLQDAAESCIRVSGPVTRSAG